MQRTLRLLTLILTSCGLLALGQAFGRPEGPQEAQTPAPLHFRYLGPAPAGRVASAAGVDGNPNVYYLGASSGGIWKSTDGGQTFVPVFDSQNAMAIGSLAVAPSDPQTVWAGTGEAWAIRGIDVMGDGIYKSTNAGRTWQNMGLEKSGRIGRIVINPTDPNTVFACVLGQITGRSQERGVYKTTDGGKTWTRVLFVNPYTGCSGLALDPHNPKVLLAGTWQVLMHSWGEFSGMWPGYQGTPGSGVYISHDGGNTWTHLTHGLPQPPLGKIDVAIAPSDGQRMYALIQTSDQGSVWRSDDGGASWRDVNWDRTLIGRAGYYIRMAVNPFNEDNVLVTNSSFHESFDGGHTFTVPRPARFGGPRLQASCGDCHDIWMDPTIPGRYVLTDDAGASIATGHSVLRISLPNGQMYHVFTDNQVPYWVYSNRQDDGTMRGPSDTSEGTGNGRVPGVDPSPHGPPGRRAPYGAPAASAPHWQYGLGGCESGFTEPAKGNPNVVWSSCYGDEITRWSARAGIARSVAPWMHTLDAPPNLLKYRCHWTPPMAIDPFNGSVYYGCQVIFQTDDQGQSWKVISPDLSQGGPQHIVSSGGLVGDNLGQYYGGVAYAIAPSPIEPHLIWAGTNNGQLWYTKDGGTHWTNVTRNIPDLPPGGTVTQISPSSFDPGTAYVAMDLHLNNDRAPYLYKTHDFGQTWTSISGELPHGNPLDYMRSVAENPNRKDMLFAGSGHGFFYSMDDGAHWTQFNRDLPASPINWITVQKRAHDVLVATYGRGLYVLPDISVLEQTGKTSYPDGVTHFYAPKAGIRQARSGRAEFDFSLARTPAKTLTFTIRDTTGAVVRTFAVTAHGGLNRVEWNLRYSAPDFVKLRTTPPADPYIWSEPRFQGRDWRPVTHWGIEGAQHAGPLAAPGQFTVSFTDSGKTYSEPFTIVKDPAIPASDADLEASTKMQVRIRNDMDEAVSMINRLELLRKQVQNDLKAHPDQSAALNRFAGKLMAVEMQLLNHESLLSDDKYYPEQYKIYMNLIWFNGVVGTGAGDVAGGANYKPTDVSYPILAGIEQKLATAKTDYDQVIQTALPAFNRQMEGKLPAIH